MLLTFPKISPPAKSSTSSKSGQVEISCNMVLFYTACRSAKSNSVLIVYCNLVKQRHEIKSSPHKGIALPYTVYYGKLLP